MARTWDDVPATVREDVRREAGGDLRRVELIDRAGGAYSVTVHPEPIGPDPAVTAELVDDPAMREVVERVRPTPLSDAGPS